MTQITPSDTLLKYISEMAAAEHTFASTLKTQEADSDLKDFPEAHRLLVSMHTLSNRHLSGLESLAEAYHGQARSSLKEAFTGITGSAVGAVNHMRSHNVSKMLRDDYATLSQIAIGYSILHSAGIALDAHKVANMSIVFLKETASFIMEVSQAVVPVVVLELTETHAISATASRNACENIRKAWREASDIAHNL